MSNDAFLMHDLGWLPTRSTELTKTIDSVWLENGLPCNSHGCHDMNTPFTNVKEGGMGFIDYMLINTQGDSEQIYRQAMAWGT